ncbi:hypothetical protein FRC02_001095 [Tulasnella sp. 418]|nr:hypothetical protein FRC02_001095 [Tulasnella sp. 418]
MSFGAFGQQSTAPSFGNTQTAPTTFGTFGQSTTQQPSAFGQQTQPQGTGFGNTQPQPQQNTGLFGNTSSATGGGFGTQQPPTGLFGTNTAQPSTQSGTAAPSIFGQSTTAPSTGQQGSSGLFGNAQQAGPSQGLFGNPSSTTQQATGPSLFGNTGATGMTNPSQPSTGMFGSTTAPATGGGLFGTQANVQASTQAPSLFGNTQNQNPPASGQPAFGQGTNTSALGTSTLGAPAFGAFGRSTAPALTASALGPPTLSILGGQAPNQALGASTQPTGTGVSVQDQIQAIYNAWDPSSSSCRFQHYFYNVVDQQQVGLYGRPPNATNEALWQKAVRENPDPSRMVPVLAVGFEDLKKRVNAQTANATAQQAKLAELSAKLEEITKKRALSTSLRAQKAGIAQAQINQRIADLIKRLHLLLPSVRSTSIRPEEENLRSLLESIEEELKKPGGMGRMKGKLNELWTALGAVKAVKERARQAGVIHAGMDGMNEWAVVDEEGLNEIAKVLSSQQQGLAHLTKILQDDARDIQIIQAGMGGKPALGISTRQGELGRSLMGMR